MKVTLAIETSCDDTSVALVRQDGFVLGILSSHQNEFHQKFGGVVPEIASRQHVMQFFPLLEKLMAEAQILSQQVDFISVTTSPGLMGSLLVGVTAAKSLAFAWGKPIVGVNHLEGHLMAPFLWDPTHTPLSTTVENSVALSVSGGHTEIYFIRKFGTYELLGKTRDDAAGEAFDKFAKMLGLPFPGGVEVDRLSAFGNPKYHDFPRGILDENKFETSFSGLKSSAQRFIADHADLTRVSDLCASFQEAIVDTLLQKLELARQKTGAMQFILTGGVSANSRLRQKSSEWAKANHVLLLIPPLRYCTDNAAMIGWVGMKKFLLGQADDIHVKASPHNL